MNIIGKKPEFEVIEVKDGNDNVIQKYYKISGVAVSEDVYCTMLQDSKEREEKRKESKKISEVFDNLEDEYECECECEDEECCERCIFVNSILNELKECDEDEKFDFLSMILYEFEKSILEDAIIFGIEMSLRNSIDMLNKQLYNLDNIELEFGD